MNPNTYIQPEQKPRLVAYACGVGMYVQLKRNDHAVARAGRRVAHSERVGMDCLPKPKARPTTHACRVGMDFGSTE